MIKDRISIKWLMLAVATVAVAGVFSLMAGAPLVLAQGDGNGGGGTATESVPVDLGKNTLYVGPRLLGLLQKHADGLQVQANVDVVIGEQEGVSVDPALADYIVSIGGRNIEGDTWRIPSAKVLSVIQRADVAVAMMPPGATGQAATYPTMDGTLNTIMSAYTDGATATSSARYAFFADQGKVLLRIQAPNATTMAGIRTWLSVRDVYMPPESDFEAFEDDVRYAMVPVSRLAALAAAYGTTHLSVETFAGEGLTQNRTGWTSEATEFETGVVSAYTEPDSSDEGGASGSSSQASATATPDPTPPTWKAANLAAKLATHGVDKWHAQGLKGDNVKVGIIDWGFSGYDRVWNLGPLRIEGKEGVVNPNAFCQPVTEGVMPGTGAFAGSKDCQPRVAGGLAYALDHGVNIAELVRDMAPNRVLKWGIVGWSAGDEGSCGSVWTYSSLARLAN